MFINNEHRNLDGSKSDSNVFATITILKSEITKLQRIVKQHEEELKELKDELNNYVKRQQ